MSEYFQKAFEQGMKVIVYEWLIILPNGEIGTSATLDSIDRESKDFKRICKMSDEEIKEFNVSEKLLALLRKSDK